MKRIAGAFLFFVLPFAARADQSPEKVVRDLYAAITAADEARANALFAPSAIQLTRDEAVDDIRARCTDVVSLHVVRAQTEGEQAEVEVAARLLRTPHGKGRHTEEVERRVFVLIRHDGRWRIKTMELLEDRLIAEIMKNPATTSQLLTRNESLVGPTLVRRLVAAATATADVRSYVSAHGGLADLAESIAVAIGDRPGLAMAMATQLQDRYVPGFDPGPLIERAEMAFRLGQESEDASVVGRTANVLGMYLMTIDESSRRAEEVYRHALQYRDSMEPRYMAIVASNLGGCLYARQNYAEAYRIFSDLLAIRGLPAERTAFSEMYLGRILEQQNNPDLALEHFRRASRIVAPKPFEIMARLGMARMHRRLGHSSEAVAALNEAWEIARPTPFKGLISQCFILEAEMEIDRGESAAAEETLQKALEYARQVKYAPSEMKALLGLGNLHARNGRFDDALRMAAAAEDITRSFDFPGSERYAALMLRARSEVALGRSEQAISSFGEAIEAIESVRSAVAGSEQDQALFFEPYHAAYTELAELLVTRGQVQEALLLSERGKGRVLLDALGQERKDSPILSTADRKKRDELVQALGKVNRNVVLLRAQEKTPVEMLNASLVEQRSAQQALEAFDIELDARDPRARLRRGEAPPMRWDALRDIVNRSDFAILEYLVQENWTTLFFIERRGEDVVVTHHRIAIPRATLSSRVESYSEQLAKRQLGFRRASSDLYELLLGPAAAHLAGKRVLCIVPDGSLWRVPFESLIDPEGKFLVQSAAVFYVPSISVYRAMTARKSGKELARRRLVAFGDPAIETSRTLIASLDRAADLGPLPDAAAEAREVARIWGRRTTVYVGAEAREDVAKRELRDARIAHFAAHGLFDDANPMFSQIVLSRAPESSEDGVLQAWELMQLEVAADLVVLSACETARGRIGAGEGLIGMSWALFVAGCPSTIVTHWKVASRSAADVMTAFHRRLAQTTDQSFAKAKSLQAAQRAALRSSASSHPYYWAGFVLIGDGGD